MRMFIPLEGENVLCLENAVAIYREDGVTVILRRNGGKERTSFTPRILAERAERLGARWAADAALMKEDMRKRSNS